MPNIVRIGGGGSGNKASTLPPPVDTLTAKPGNEKATVTFQTLDDEYNGYLGTPAYVLVIKEGSIPESPTDGIAVRFNKAGEEIV